MSQNDEPVTRTMLNPDDYYSVREAAEVSKRYRGSILRALAADNVLGAILVKGL